MQNHARKTHDRSGVAATEFAVCLPIIVVIIVGTIEACSMIYLKQTLSVAAYEGVRASLKPGATATEVADACNRVLTARNTQGATITITPSNFSSQAAETWITVDIAAPGGANSVMSGWFYDSLSVTGSATMMKEY